MKPLIHIDENLIRIDTDQYILSLVFKQQPVKLISDETIIAHRLGDTCNSLHKTSTSKHHSLTLQKKYCAKCGNEFKPLSNAQKYCSAKCGMKKKWVKKSVLDKTLAEIERKRNEPYKLTPPVN